MSVNSIRSRKQPTDNHKQRTTTVKAKSRASIKGAALQFMGLTQRLLPCSAVLRGDKGSGTLAHSEGLTAISCSSPAITAVFNTYELLESILTHLLIRDLAKCQRICQRFHNIIVRSLPLQQNLFLKLRPTTTCLQCQRHLSSCFSGDTRIVTRPTPTTSTVAKQYTYTILRLHPALCDGDILYSIPSDTDADLDRFRRLSKTMCSMHVSQPPSTRITLGLKRRYSVQARTIMIANRDGVRIGHLLEKLREMLLLPLTERQQKKRAMSLERNQVRWLESFLAGLPDVC